MIGLRPREARQLDPIAPYRFGLRHDAAGTRRKWLWTWRRHVAVRDLILAADRMADRWAEGDAQVRNELWQRLHQAVDTARTALS